MAVITDSVSGIMPMSTELEEALARTTFEYEFIDYIPLDLHKDDYSCVVLMSRGAAVSCRTEVLDRYIRDGGALICGGGIPYYLFPVDTIAPLIDWFACEDYTNASGMIIATDSATQYGFESMQMLDSVSCSYSFGALDKPLPECKVIAMWFCNGTERGIAISQSNCGEGKVFYLSRPIQADYMRQMFETFLDTAPEYIWGDANSSGYVDVDDVVFLIAYLFSQGSPPKLMSAADPTGDGFVDIDDITRIVDYLFRGQGEMNAGGYED